MLARDPPAVEHTYGPDCPLCPGRHAEPSRCDLSGYGVGWLHFVDRHAEAYLAALYDGGSTSSGELERLGREWATLPPRHGCSCNAAHCPACAALAPTCARCADLPWLSRPRRCEDCDRLRATPSRAEIGRTRPVHAPAPQADLIDYVTGLALSSARRRVA